MKPRQAPLVKPPPPPEPPPVILVQAPLPGFIDILPILRPIKGWGSSRQGLSPLAPPGLPPSLPKPTQGPPTPKDKGHLP